MLVYELLPYERGQEVDVEATDLRRISGERQSDSWVPLQAELISREGRKRLEPVDAIYLIGGDFLVLKDAAVSRVRDALSASVEFLPLVCRQEPLTLLNVVQVVDALDEEESDIKRFPSSGRVMYVNHHVFRPEALPSEGLFRVPQARATMFCTEATVPLLRERLTGLNLQPVWEG